MTNHPDQHSFVEAARLMVLPEEPFALETVWLWNKPSTWLGGIWAFQSARRMGDVERAKLVLAFVFAGRNDSARAVIAWAPNDRWAHVLGRGLAQERRGDLLLLLCQSLTETAWGLVALGTAGDMKRLDVVEHLLSQHENKRAVSCRSATLVEAAFPTCMNVLAELMRGSSSEAICAAVMAVSMHAKPNISAFLALTKGLDAFENCSFAKGASWERCFSCLLPHLTTYEALGLCQGRHLLRQREEMLLAGVGAGREDVVQALMDFPMSEDIVVHGLTQAVRTHQKDIARALLKAPIDSKRLLAPLWHALQDGDSKMVDVVAEAAPGDVHETVMHMCARHDGWENADTLFAHLVPEAQRYWLNRHPELANHPHGQSAFLRLSLQQEIGDTGRGTEKRRM